MFPKLRECDTDDDVAMRFLRSGEGFEKYLQYLVGQQKAEAAISDKTVHHFFKASEPFSSTVNTNGHKCVCVVIFVNIMDC